jgi:NitT/TauT family transport system substrate-binding protein
MKRAERHCGRRDWLVISLGVLSGLSFGRSGAARGAAAANEIRLGILQFGTLQWIADVIRRHHLDAAQGIALETALLANTDAGRIALMAGADDVVVSDWMFAAAQRAAGTPLCFAPFSSALGGIMAPASSSIRGLADLRGRRLGVAGGPLDKSWLVVQAAARTTRSIDLASAAHVVYGAPPLLDAKLQQGELDAVLTFWNFAARLEARGYRELISVADCAHALGLPAELNLVGFVFHEDWAKAHRRTIDGFLASVGAAERLLASSSAEWTHVRPLMDAANDQLFDSLRRRFVAGIAAEPSAAQSQQTAERVFAILLKTGGAHATAGLKALPDGIFWQRSNASG